MTIKGYSSFLEVLQELHHRIVECHITRTLDGGFYRSTEVQSVYSTATADWFKKDQSVIGIGEVKSLNFEPSKPSFPLGVDYE